MANTTLVANQGSKCFVYVRAPGPYASFGGFAGGKEILIDGYVTMYKVQWPQRMSGNFVLKLEDV